MNTTIIKTPEPLSSARGIVLFLHGMADHKERYLPIMEYLSNQGFICAIRDMKGHGDNMVEHNGLGYLGEERVDGLINDVHHTVLSLKHMYPNLPLNLIGHSMGSLLARAYCKHHDEELSKLVVIGSPSYRTLTPLAILVTQAMRLVRKDTSVSQLFQTLSVGEYERKMPKGSSKNGWICSNKSVVDSYNTDPLCGFPFTINGNLTLFELMQYTYAIHDWYKVKENMPILFLSGKDDPCRISDKAFSRAVNHMKQVGYKNVTYRLYYGMRHEILNETDYKMVWNEIEEFL